MKNMNFLNIIKNLFFIDIGNIIINFWMNLCIGDMRRSVICIMIDILDKCIGIFG